MRKISLRNQRLARVALVCLLASGLSHAGVYRWVDKQGVVHYSDSAVVSGAQTLELHTSGTVERNRPPPPTSPPPDATTDTTRTATVRAEQCAKAKKQLASYRGAEKILLTEPDGKKRELTAEEQVQEIVRTEKRVEALCEGGT